MSSSILVVDDDALMRKSLAYNLGLAGYRVTTASTATDALALAGSELPDLILLDVGLPGMDGLEALTHIKQMFNTPVIFVTARRQKLDEVVGLDQGADDYITKPFDMDVLLAHIKAVLRRYQQPPEAPPDGVTIRLADLVIDPSAHIVSVGGKSIDLSPREFDLLYAFCLRPGQVLSVEELLRQVWGVDYIGEPQVVYVHIRWLREKLEQDPNKPERIVTVRGVGYKLIPKGN